MASSTVHSIQVSVPILPASLKLRIIALTISRVVKQAVDEAAARGAGAGK